MEEHLDRINFLVCVFMGKAKLISHEMDSSLSFNTMIIGHA